MTAGLQQNAKFYTRNLQEAIQVLDNGTLPDAAKVGALEALQFLLEPIDNANGGAACSASTGCLEAVSVLLDTRW